MAMRGRVLHRAAYLCLAWMVAASAVLAAPASAGAAPYAGIVMDMRSGEVYYDHRADIKQHPASLTKMMTLYLTFEALERGQIRLDQQVRVSKHAASQPPSKLYLKAGQRVRIRDLIRATAIKSANDAAMVLAETIGGSQKRFGEMMTAKARALGMRNSTFRNPHGLTQSGHLSTARDMAILARHLYFDFPAYYNVFGRKNDTAAGKRIRNTNRLLATYSGAEGMKTGFTRAAGYNLVSIAARGQERVIAVVFGGNSTRSRNAQAAKLLDLGFRKAPTQVAISRPGKAAVRTKVAQAPLPPTRGDGPATAGEALAAAFATPAVAATGPMSTSRYAPLYAELPPRRGNVRLAGWSVELGTFDNEASAVAVLASVAIDEVSAIRSANAVIDRVEGQSGKAWKLRFEGFDREGAARACRALADYDGTCRSVAAR